MLHEFSRTGLLLGEEALTRLQKSRVAVFGIGGVGSFTAEALARSGVGQFHLIDNDEVSVTNLNRQLIALHSTIGRKKVDVMKQRIADINPRAQVDVYPCFYLDDNKDLIDFSQLDYIVDAIDTVSSKLLLIEQAKSHSVPVISCMGAGNKLDPTAFEVTDISKTSVCPLARVMRRELKKRGIQHVKVVYSKEEALKPAASEELSNGTDTAGSTAFGQQKRQIPGSCAFVPSVAGLIAASEVIKDLAGIR